MIEKSTDIEDMLRFHHIGIACRSIKLEGKTWRELGYCQEGDLFCDAAQGICGIFLTGPGPRVELLEPFEQSDTLKPFLNLGIKMYHQAYETPDIKQIAERLKQSRAKVLSEAKPAIAFDGRFVSFLMMPNSLIIELIEAP